VDGSHVQNQLIFTGQLPLVRLSERNDYRAALINFQRARRALMLAEDLIVSTVRREIRQLRVIQKNYKIQQQLVELAYKQLDSAREAFQAPQEPVIDPNRQIQAPGRTSAANAAALTGQLLSAQSNLNRNQLALYSLWISYVNSRIQLYRDLELMPIDLRGVWIDDAATREPLPATLADGQCPGGAHGPAPARARRPGPRSAPLLPPS